jgi:hypothetical protein
MSLDDFEVVFKIDDVRVIKVAGACDDGGGGGVVDALSLDDVLPFSTS